MLTGAQELAEQVFDLPVRIGTPIAVDGLTEVVNHPKHATGVGLLLYDDAWSTGRSDRTSSPRWWRTSVNHLRKAITSFV